MLPRTQHATAEGVGVISALEIPMVKDSTKESARHNTETFEYKTWHGEKKWGYCQLGT